MDWGSVLSAAAVIMALASAAYVGVQRGVQSNLREQLGDARGQVQALKDERSDLQATAARLSSEMAALRGVVTGEVHWTSISELLEHHHQLAERHWTEAESALDSILRQLQNREG